MADRPSTYSRWWRIGGGLVFALYFTFGLLYFETFPFEKAWLHVPAGLILAVQCVTLAHLLYGPKKAGKVTRPRDYLLWPTLTFGITGLVLFAYAGLAGTQGFNWNLLSQVYFHLLLVGLLPVVATLVILQGSAQVRQQSRKAKELVREREPVQQSVQETPSNAPDSEEVTHFQLSADKAGEDFKVPFADLVFVEAADNYCKFHYFREGKPRSKTLRITMKEVEGYLPPSTGFFRCHRSFLVNGSRVEEVLGTSQAHRLKMEGFEAPVPVSRSFEVDRFRKEG